jgi:penicillin-binding protein 1A
MQLHAEEAVSAHMANLQEEFYSGKRIKTLHLWHLRQKQRILTNAMKASNRWSV